MAGADRDVRERLFSKAAKQIREIIRILESKKKLMVYTREKHLGAYLSLIHLEYLRRNYKAAIDCCNYVQGISSEFRVVVSLYHKLIMLRMNGQECQVTNFLNVISRKSNTIEKLVFQEAVLAFRVHKQYDCAIRLEMACGSSQRSSELKSKLSLILTYLERHRVDFQKRSQMRKEDYLSICSLMLSLKEGNPLELDNADQYSLVFAQWDYLTHTLASNESAKEEGIISALANVKAFLYCSLEVVLDFGGSSKIGLDRCYTCNQAVTSTEVQYVCSGCRVACYCSIDHQRATWKKDAVKGLGIGHEILCPLYKALRKFELQLASKDSDEEKESRSRRRFERECRKFLENGLGLKNKCFPCEYKK